MSDQQQQAPAPAEIANPRYCVQKAHPEGYAIIDTTSKDEPYTINALGSLKSYERRALTPAAIERYEQYNQRVAEQWAHTWNLVALGYCGACKKLLAQIPGHENERHTATGYNRLDRIICFYCACSQG